MGRFILGRTPGKISINRGLMGLNLVWREGNTYFAHLLPDSAHYPKPNFIETEPYKPV